MGEHGLTLLLIELRCVGARQADVEGDRLEAVVPGDDDPQVSVDLARWISAPFAVWMDGWFLESVQQAQPAPVETTAAPRLREADVVALVERSIVVFERLGGLDERDQLLSKDIVRSNVLTASSPWEMPGWRCSSKCCRATSFAQPSSSWPWPTARSSAKTPRAANSLLLGPRARSRAIAAPG